ncbi:protein FAM53A-like [Anneissia japonica]|uniref:protein FAM53A-like n=1 Tax=Anneissia japonica TaxID=1529436 RepID=UPI0014256CDF|nr:protein FAM53A-like [Anneissia japonica]XP_033113431.1 protein FAM53A-like [Anneissia japonica]
MVTLITEKLQNQSLEDVNIPDYTHIAYHTRSRTKACQLSHKQVNSSVDSRIYTSNFRSTNSKSSTYSSDMPSAEPMHAVSAPCQIPSKQNEVARNNSINSQAQTPTAAPPKKRHCRSLSAGELTEQRAQTWKPRASKVWRPVTKSKLDTYQGHIPMHNFNTLAGLPNNYTPISTFSELDNEFSTPPESPVPRPASATSWDDSLNMPWLDANSLHHQIGQKSWYCSVDKVSESSGSVVSVTSVSSTPELERKGVGMLRCRSQPCVSGRRGGKKRRREEDTRPKLDFFKMEETSYTRCTQRQKKMSKQVGMYCSEMEQYFGLKTIASSPCDGNHASSVLITPTSSPTKELEKTFDDERILGGHSSNSDEDDSGNEDEFDDTLEDIIFPIDPDNELDLDEIENN